MTHTAQDIRDYGRSTAEAGDALRAASVRERIAWLVKAADLLSEDAREHQAHLADETGLSAPMVQWGTRTTLETVHEAALRSVAEDAARAGGEPVDMLAVVLAGNLFTTSVRAVFVPLLLGVPVLVKSSSRETAFASMVEDALERAHPSLGDGVKLVAFPGGDVEREAALLESAAAVAVYGTDQTVAEIQARHPAVPIVAHGHGVSAAYCGADSLDDEHLDDTIQALALDICAYDQRGCLSPQVVYVQETRDRTTLAFAERLAADGLARLEERLPRGPLPIEVGAAQAQWRGLAEIEGELITGDGFSIGIRKKTDPIRWSPGYRNVSLAAVSGLAEAMEALRHLGGNLKCIGVDAASLGALETELRSSPTSKAYACPLGSMQTPGFDAPSDGEPVWHGLLR